jgi:hypothetical protein
LKSSTSLNIDMNLISFVNQGQSIYIPGRLETSSWLGSWRIGGSSEGRLIHSRASHDLAVHLKESYFCSSVEYDNFGIPTNATQKWWSSIVIIVLLIVGYFDSSICNYSIPINKERNKYWLHSRRVTERYHLAETNFYRYPDSKQRCLLLRVDLYEEDCHPVQCRKKSEDCHFSKYTLSTDKI